MSDAPATEAASPRYADIETWPDAAVLDALLENQLAAVASVRPALPSIAAAAAAAVPRLQAGGRLAYAGAGTSGRIAVQDGAEMPPTFGWPPDRLVLMVAGGPAALLQAVEGAEDQPADVSMLGAGDVLVAVAASGGTPFTVSAVVAARAAGALTIGLANNPGAPLLIAAECPILLSTGPEPLAGSTRMGAGTAQKAALNVWSTLVMIRLGHVYRGRMVSVRPTNAKLRHRAVRMVMELGAMDREAAEAALAAAAGNVRDALRSLGGMNAGDRPGPIVPND